MKPSSLVSARSFVRSSKQRLKEALRPWVRSFTERRVDLPLSEWCLTRDAEGRLCLGGLALGELMEKHGSPLHVVDALRLDENARDFLAVPEGAKAGCEVFYSYKTNPVPGVLQRLHRQGVGAEVISAYELWLALRLGVDPSRIIYNGPVKSPESLREALVRGVGYVNFNCREEVAPFAALARELGKRPQVGMRVVVPGGWSGQFGETVEDGAAFAAYEEALRHPELQVCSLHCHLGGEISSQGQLVAFVDRVLEFVDLLHARLGLELSVLDFGGSLACPTTTKLGFEQLRLNRTFGADLIPRPPSEVLSISDYVKTLVERVERHFEAAGRERPRLFLEPGRAMTGNTQMMLCKVAVVKEGGEVPHLILDAGMNLAQACQNEYHQLFTVDAPRSEARRLYRLAGPICTPGDILYYGWELPELRPNDALAVMDSGAYFVPFATSFSFPQPPIVLVEEGRQTLLRRGERYEDVIALDEGY